MPCALRRLFHRELEDGSRSREEQSRHEQPRTHTWLRPQELGKGLMGQASCFPAGRLRWSETQGGNRLQASSYYRVTLLCVRVLSETQHRSPGSCDLQFALCREERGRGAKVTICTPGRLPPRRLFTELVFYVFLFKDTLCSVNCRISNTELWASALHPLPEPSSPNSCFLGKARHSRLARRPFSPVLGGHFKLKSQQKAQKRGTKQTAKRTVSSLS